MSWKCELMICNIIPDSLLIKLLKKEKNEDRKTHLVDDLIISSQHRAVRTMFLNNNNIKNILQPRNEKRHTKVINFYDCANSWNFPETPIKTVDEKHGRGKGHHHGSHTHENKQQEFMHITYDFFHDMYKRESFDAKNATVNFYTNYGQNYDNAFWDGEIMVFGNGDPRYFKPFGEFIDIVGHEFGHAVTQYESDLVYQGQPGALNEHASDVFGTIIKQYHNKQTVDTADWLIGGGLWNTETMGAEYKALRDMKNPGDAYPEDDQPNHMNNYYSGEADNQGVHINSGIPNRAFYNAVLNLGDTHSWQRAGIIWYRALGDQRFVTESSDFKDFANTTIRYAWRHYGEPARQAVKTAWSDVGIITTY